MSGARIVVAGIGADGWGGLGESARVAILSAEEIVGSPRQLALLPADAPPVRSWPSPIGPLIDELVARPDGTVCVLASGDPMLHGIGATLARRVDPERLTVIPQPSAWALACARLRWPAAEVGLVSAVARSPDIVARVLQPGRRAVVYVTGASGATGIARVLCERGYGSSRFIVLEQLGGPGEHVREFCARDWGQLDADPLHVVAIECIRDPGTPLHAVVAGLPDAAYESDGALTKRHVRAATLAALAPAPSALLWDVGAGSGSVAIEWLRAEPTAHAIAIEQRDDRAARIERNARALGVPGLDVRRGTAPAVLDGLPPADATFIGGGLTPEVVRRCWDALAPGGRMVANAVSLEGEQVLAAARSRLGGELARIEVSHAEPLGRLTGWRAQRPVVQWSAEKLAR